MAINMRVTSTTVVAVPDDIAADFKEAYETLVKLPSNKTLTTDPFTSEGYAGPAKIDGEDVTEEYKAAWNARRFTRQGREWASTQTGPSGRPLVFVRKGDIKGSPAEVTFRIYEQRESTSAE